MENNQAPSITEGSTFQTGLFDSFQKEFHQINKTQGRGWPGAPPGASKKEDQWAAFKSSTEVMLHVYPLLYLRRGVSPLGKFPVHTKSQLYDVLVAQATAVVEWAASQAFDSIRQSLGVDRYLVLVKRQVRARISRMCMCVCVCAMRVIYVCRMRRSHVGKDAMAVLSDTHTHVMGVGDMHVMTTL